MEPIAETVIAVEEFGPFWADGDLLNGLRQLAREVQGLVPDVVGMSLATLAHGITFTLVASDETIAVLDAVQYIAGGPCVTAVEGERVVAMTGEELLEEADWQLFARATTASAIRSTLTLPVLTEGRVSGSVNLYAASAGAFLGHHEEIARIFDAWAPGAVTNADLDFTTRRTAEQAPALLHQEMRIQVAIGIIVAEEGVGVEEATRRLRDAAEQAGVTQAAVAEILIVGLEDDAGEQSTG